MVIDTSAVIAVLGHEPEGHHLGGLIATMPPALISTGTYLECRIVAEARWGRPGVVDLNNMIASASMAIMPFDHDQAMIAADAYSRYGRGRHPAGLNFGDCFAYALSKLTGEPLLFKGDDFTHTDVISVTHP